VKACTSTLLLALCLLVVGCAHYQRTYFRVVDSASRESVPSASLTTQFTLGALAFTDLFRPEWTHTQNQEGYTQSNGLAKLKVPMSRPSGMHPQDKDGNPVDPNDVVGATVTVAKQGYTARQVYYSNNKWREVGKATSPDSPFLIELTRTRTEQKKD
jgi:hypothetical protein